MQSFTYFKQIYQYSKSKTHIFTTNLHTRQFYL